MTLEPIDDFEKEVLDKHNNEFRIVQFQAENFKAIKVIELTPHGDTVIISGPNASGKTSLMDAIFVTLGGKKALNKLPDLIRHGEKHAKVVVDLGVKNTDNFVENAYTVTREWNEDKTTLTVTNSKGMRYPNASAFLDSIVGELSFDPLAFANQSEKNQIKTLLELVKLPIDLYALDDDRKLLYESRTLVNRAVKHLDGKVAGFPVVDAPDKEVNTSDIMSAMELATTEISDNIEMRNSYFHKVDQKRDLTFAVRALETELLEKQDKLVSIECEIDQLKPLVDNAIDPDLTVFKEQLQNAEQINTNVRSMKQRTQIQDELDSEIANSENLTTQIKEIDELKERTIREAEMPVEGLGFNDLGVTFNDTLIKQCSTAEQNKISVAIGMAMNPKLKVLLIRDGSALDSNSMNDISEMVKEKGYQAWIEVVRDDQTLGVCIEDGMVAHDNYKNPQ